jgi:hypothetical protein
MKNRFQSLPFKCKPAALQSGGEEKEKKVYGGGQQIPFGDPIKE